MCDDKELTVAPFDEKTLLTTFCLSQDNTIWATPPHTRYIYLASDSEISSESVNHNRAGSSTISHMASLPILIVPSIG